MTSSTMRGVRRSLMLLAAGTFATTGAAAQQPARVPPGAIVQPLGQDDGAQLRRHLTTLADNPRSLDALIGAGRAALEMGDAEAALSFFGRADEISPRNARAKAGMASAFVRLGRAQAALSLFGEAVAFGAPTAEIAGDRGLAYDMTGDPRRAQQDYLLALRHRDDPEIRRRMALSLAISGEREAALRMIDGQLRRNDRAGWRTQAFVLALTGDAAGASRTAQGVMPAGAALAMAPFLARLASLSPAQKAMAVHFGHFPSDGRALAGASPADTAADPGAVALAMDGPPPAAAPRTQPAQPPPAATRRRSGTRHSVAPAPRRRVAAVRDSSDPYGLRETSRPARRQPSPAPAPQEAEPRPAEIAQVNTRWAGAPAAPPQQQPQQPQPMRTPQTERPAATPTQPAPSVQTGGAAAPSRQGATTPSAIDPAPRPPVEIASTTADQPSISAPAAAPVAAETRPQPATPSDASPGFTLIPPATPPAASPAAPERSPLADIASVVNSLPQEEQSRPAPAPAAPPEARADSIRTAPSRPTSPPPARRQAAQPSHPSRHWVQVATVPDPAALAREYARLRARATDRLGGRTAYATPYGRSSNRLLVGPFASAREAQEFVNQLAQRQVAAFAWTSPAGQEIERLQTR